MCYTVSPGCLQSSRPEPCLVIFMGTVFLAAAGKRTCWDVGKIALLGPMLSQPSLPSTERRKLRWERTQQISKIFFCLQGWGSFCNFAHTHTWSCLYTSFTILFSQNVKGKNSSNKSINIPIFKKFPCMDLIPLFFIKCFSNRVPRYSTKNLQGFWAFKILCVHVDDNLKTVLNQFQV